MMLLNLFLGFLKVGCFSFGGAYAAIPLIRDIVLSYGWLDEEMMAYMIAVSESTPGPIMVNLATYVGTSQAGIMGAMVATFAVVLPSFLIVLAVTAILSKVIKNKYVQAALRGIKPGMIGIILTTGCWMIFKNLFNNSFGAINIRAVIITVILGAVYFGQKKILKRNVSPIMLIIISSILGMVEYAL
jgi:chromate transporter